MTFKSLVKQKKNKDETGKNEIINKQQFKDNLKYLTDVDDKIYGLHFTYEDPISNKINKNDRLEIIEESSIIGKEIANKVFKKYSTNNVCKLIKINNVKLEIVEEKDKKKFVYFGTYDTDGPITLYKGNILISERLIKDLEIKFMTVKQISDIVLAHELFHFYEDEYPDLYTNTKEISLWSLGLYTHKSTLISPSEIAAMTFTKELLNLQFNPAAINYLLYSSIDVKAGKVFYNNIIKRENDSI